MTIIDIRNDAKRPLDDGSRLVIDSLKNGYDIETIILSPSIFSSLTAMQIASCMKRKPTDAVICHTHKDLIAACSAQKLVSGAKYKIIFRPYPESRAPRAVTAEIARTVSHCLYHNNAEQQTWQQAFVQHTSAPKSSILDIAACGDTSAKAPRYTAGDTLNILWDGAINEPQRLDSMIETMIRIRRCNPEFISKIRLYIKGQGKARYVMPIVRKSRNHTALNIVWCGVGDAKHPEATGGNSTIALPENVHINVQTETTTTSEQAKELSRGIPLLDPCDTVGAAAFITDIITTDDSYDNACNAARERYKTANAPCFHVEQWLRILSVKSADK